MTTTSATGICSSRHPSPARPCGTPGRGAGFTLLEVMVVVVLIGIILSFAVITAGGDRRGALLREGERLAALIELAREEALFQGRELGVLFTETGYRFLVLEPERERWAAPDDPGALRRRTLPADMRLRLELEGEPVDLPLDLENPAGKAPPVLVLSSGEVTPFELRLETTDREHHLWLRADAFGGLELEPDEA